MAKDTPKEPGVEIKASPEVETPTEEKSTPDNQPLQDNGKAPATELAAGEAAAALSHEGETIPDPGNVVVPFKKIEEIMTERKMAATEAEKKVAEQDKAEKEPPAPEQQPEKRTAPRSRPPKAGRAGRHDKEPSQEAPKVKSKDTRQDREKPPSNHTPTKDRKSKAVKEKPVAEKKEQVSEGPTLEVRKQKLEQELREKYGIPKTDKPVEPWIAPEVEQVVRIPHDKLHSFKDHPFSVEKNAKFMAFVSSIRANGVTQPAVVRPDGRDGYEIISGHRRNLGSIEAEIPFTPCIIRALNDEQSIQQMVEDNVNNREISTMELAKALKMQLDAIKHQGARQAIEGQDFSTDIDKRSNEIVAERNGMSVKQVQRHIVLTRLTPALQQMVDGKTVDGNKTLKLAFTPAVELSYVKPKNQEYIAVAIEGQQSAPSLSQAQRMRQLDQKGLLNADVIDGILLEEKKEVDKVIISSQELSQYFGKEKTPREMKDQIIKLLDEWKEKQPELAKPEKKQEQEK